MYTNSVFHSHGTSPKASMIQSAMISPNLFYQEINWILSRLAQASSLGFYYEIDPGFLYLFSLAIMFGSFSKEPTYATAYDAAFTCIVLSL